MDTKLIYGKEIQIDIEATIQLLIQDEDTDQDKKITVDDFPVLNTERGDRQFILKSTDDRTYEIYGTYYLANLLNELVLQRDEGKQIATISTERIFESPVERTSRMIRDNYWKGLTRQIDAEHLIDILKDSKVNSNGMHYLYVPYHDTVALEYFRQIKPDQKDIRLHIVRLPKVTTPAYVKKLEGKHGLLPLKLITSSSGEIQGLPFIVPGGRFNEMYGWDSYFEALGLISDDKVKLAKNMVDHFVYEIKHYGKILNANRTYYLTRSQPPFLTSMALAVYEALPKNDVSKKWLKTVLLAAIREYKTVWMDQNHLTEIGLNRYYGTGMGVPPEVEPDHFDPIFQSYAQKHGMSLNQFIRFYKENKIKDPELDAFFRHDRAVRESGHDTTCRWRLDGKDCCADFVTVDLNALLYKFEIDIGMMIKNIFNDSLKGEQSKTWFSRARKRKALILKYLWNPVEHLFFDYHVPKQKQSEYISAATFYPLWACHPNNPETKILNDKTADLSIKHALICLENQGGILSGSKESRERYGIRGEERQWDFPHGWAPHQMLVWRALHHYRHADIADRLIYKWLYTITKNAVNYNGTIPEKFNVVKRSHKVFTEYGNVGTEFSYMTKEGFGWMNASYQVGLDMLSTKYIVSLENLIPPEWLAFK